MPGGKPLHSNRGRSFPGRDGSPSRSLEWPDSPASSSKPVSFQPTTGTGSESRPYLERKTPAAINPSHLLSQGHPPGWQKQELAIGTSACCHAVRKRAATAAASSILPWPEQRAGTTPGATSRFPVAAGGRRGRPVRPRRTGWPPAGWRRAHAAPAAASPAARCNAARPPLRPRSGVAPARPPACPHGRGFRPRPWV